LRLCWLNKSSLQGNLLSCFTEVAPSGFPLVQCTLPFAHQYSRIVIRRRLFSGQSIRRPDSGRSRADELNFRSENSQPVLVCSVNSLTMAWSDGGDRPLRAADDADRPVGPQCTPEAAFLMYTFKVGAAAAAAAAAT
jgi:hypothetical protein